MVGWFAAAQRVVVHARQVVVNEGVSVDAFNARCAHKGILQLAANSRAGRQRQHRTQAFAAGKQAVGHGIDEHVIVAVFFRQKRWQGLFDELLQRGHFFLAHDHSSI